MSDWSPRWDIFKGTVIILFGLCWFAITALFGTLWSMMVWIIRDLPRMLYCRFLHRKYLQVIEETDMMPFGIGGHTHSYFLHCNKCNRNLWVVNAPD